VIPDHNQSGVLPPFLPESSPSAPSSMAPFKVSLLEVAQRFSTSNARFEIIRGLISYRTELRKEGIASGFQWIDGSFVEDVERNKGRSPNDVDIITFANRPSTYLDPKKWRDFIERRQDLFLPIESKKNYRCDAYYVDMNLQPEMLINITKYWFGLFSHQRDTFLWKGMLEVPLDDDKDVIQFLRNGGNYAS
jgi:hypothetical protein